MSSIEAIRCCDFGCYIVVQYELIYRLYAAIPRSSIFVMFRLSFLLYCPLCVTGVVVLGLLVSFATGKGAHRGENPCFVLLGETENDDEGDGISGT